MGDNKFVQNVILTLVVTVFLLGFTSAGFSNIFSSFTGKATTQNVGVNISVGNTAPQIYNVSFIAAQTPTESGATRIYFNFSVVDADGNANLKLTSARANFSLSGEPTRVNNTCNNLSISGNYANFTCSVELQYFDNSGTWTIGTAINDSSDAIGSNNTNVFTYNQLSAFVLGPGNLTFTSLSPGGANQTANNDPLVLNNTGNKAITDGNILINATDLVGETTSSQRIYANNFSAGVVTGGSAECGFATNQSTNLSKSNFAFIPNATLSRGNNSANDGITAQRGIYFCIRLVGNELSSQAYSTTNQGAWTAKIA